jgi:hypothetical protein
VDAPAAATAMEAAGESHGKTPQSLAGVVQAFGSEGLEALAGSLVAADQLELPSHDTHRQPRLPARQLLPWIEAAEAPAPVETPHLPAGPAPMD